MATGSRIGRAVCVVSLCLACLAAPVGAVDKQVTALRKNGAISLDGDLSEAIWDRASKAGAFWQRLPKEGAEPEWPTEFRVVYDNDAIYIGVQAFDSEPGKIRSMLTRRDVESASDWLLVGIDSYHDKRTAFAFAINPAGVQRDFLIFNDSETDASWDAVWTAAAGVNETGWSAEFRIPLNQLRFSPDEHKVWGLQVVRTVGRTNEQSVWSPWPRNGPRMVSRFGEVRGLDGITTPRRLELLPYTVGAIGFGNVAAGDPLNSDVASSGNIGLDFEYGLGNNFTLAGTVNPDFGQVEADPSEVNLSDAESFFQDKRPFFLEGIDIFKFQLVAAGGNQAEQLFYTRRIGASPHDSVAGHGEYFSEPNMTTIYGAAKVSGKTSDGWSFGLLDAVTEAETGTYVDELGERHARVIEPLTNYSVLRLGKDMRGGRTNLSGALTSVHRRLAGTELSWLHDQAYSGGLSLNHRFAQQRWILRTRLVGSYVHGSQGAIDRTQRASQRYFQRPDAAHLDYDPTRRSLTGAGLLWAVLKLSGGKWQYGAGGQVRTPGLELNDLGFQRLSDNASQWVWLQYRNNEPGEHFLEYNVNTDVWAETDLSPMLVASGVSFNAWGRFKNFWNGYAGVNLMQRFMNPRALRGGPALRGLRGLGFWMGGSTDTRKLIRADLNLSGNLQPTSDSGRISVNAGLAMQLRSNLNVSLGASLSRNVVDDQYVSQTACMAIIGALAEASTGPGQLDCLLPEPGQVLGQAAYILGRLDQTTVGGTLRLDYTFRPTLTLQLYAQPFASTGRYTDYRSVEDPRARGYRDRFHVFAPRELTLANGDYLVDRDGDDSTDFTFPRADFNFRQLRTNLVLRWEYLPGSAVFLVWGHERSSSEDNGEFRFDRELDGLLSASGTHVVMVKASYWYAI